MLIGNSILIPYRPIIDYSESETYATDVFASQNNTEKRMKIVENPKRSISMKIIVNNERELQDLESIVTYASRYYCYVPLWFSMVVAKSSSTSSTISCDTSLMDIKVGDYILIDRDYAQVTAFDNNSMTIDRNFNLNNIRVAPLLYATIQNSNSYSFVTKKVGEFTLEFKELL